MVFIPINSFVLVKPITNDRLMQRSSAALMPKADMTGPPTRGEVLFSSSEGIEPGDEVVFVAESIKAIQIEGEKMLPIRLKEIKGVISHE